MRDGFRVPDFTAPLDLASRVARCPPAEVKGVMFSSITERARRAGAPIGRDRYLGFRGYPLREWLEVLPAAARALHPDVPVREGIRRVGHGAYAGFTRSQVGGVVMSFAGRSLELAVPLAGRTYEVLRAHGKVRCVEHEARRAVFEFRGFWDWIDAYHVGVLEGALRAFGADGRVRCRMLSELDGDLEVTW